MGGSGLGQYTSMNILGCLDAPNNAHCVVLDDLIDGYTLVGTHWFWRLSCHQSLQ
jgi:ABC-type lipoprotein export system ATPase subunit